MTIQQQARDELADGAVNANTVSLLCDALDKALRERDEAMESAAGRWDRMERARAILDGEA